MRKYLLGTLALYVFLCPKLLSEGESGGGENNSEGDTLADPPQPAEGTFDDAATQLVQAVLSASHRAALKNGNELELEIEKICGKIISETVEKSKDLRSLRSEVLKGLGEGTNARGECFPDVKVTSSVSAEHGTESREEYTDGKRNPGTKTLHNTTNVSGSPVALSLKQTLFNGGASLARIRQTSYEAKAAYANYKAKEGAAIEQMLKLAFDIIMYRLILKYSEISTTIYKEVLKSALDKLKVGEVDRSEVALTETEVAKSEAKLCEIRSRLEALEGDLLRFTGIHSNDLPLVFPNLFKLIPHTIEEVKEIATKENAQLQAGHWSVLASKAAISRARAAYAPVVELTANTSISRSFARSQKSKENNPVDFYETDIKRSGPGNASVGVSVSLPIDIKRVLSTALGGARQDHVRFRIAADKGYGDTMSNIETSWGNLTHKKNAVDANKRRVKACMIQLQAALQELAVGAKVYTQVLKAQSNVLDAQEAYVQAENSYVLEVLHLLELMGRLNPQSFGSNALDFNEGTAATYKDVAYAADSKDDGEKENEDGNDSPDKDAKGVVYVKDGGASKIYPQRVDMRPIL
ncbi:MAG: TolC family protein [Holosporales bacterium]|jgi:outer membrane protein|nr:TolC family protein [Holosporales bacterium]